MRLSRVLLCLAAAVLLASGAIAQDLPARCAGLCRADDDGHFVAMADLARPSSALDGDDLLAPVNRSPAGALPPDYSPTDMVNLETMRPTRAWRCTPPRRQCLRREAARAYRRLARAMREAGHSPHVSSAFRAYAVQCSTFARWARPEHGGFCAATTVSALPGHSQHQLGTTIDLFTYAWTGEGDKFRPGFGCSPGGRWIAEHGPEHGFVLPYPLHPDYRAPGSECRASEEGVARIDPRTGYRYEPWHLRYVGIDNAARFREALRASGPGTHGEITVEQWLGGERAIAAPVCDGCNCDRCATFGSEGPCRTPAWVLDDRGRYGAPEHAPRVLGASMRREGERITLEVRVDVAQNTATQPPLLSAGTFYRRGERAVWLDAERRRTFEAIEGTYRIAIGFDRRADWPWHAALVGAERDGLENGFGAAIPATPGELVVRVRMEGVRRGTLVRVGIAHGRSVDGVDWRGRAP